MRSHVNKSDQQVNVFFFSIPILFGFKHHLQRIFVFLLLHRKSFQGLVRQFGKWNSAKWKPSYTREDTSSTLITADGGQDSRKHKDIYQSLTSE